MHQRTGPLTFRPAPFSAPTLVVGFILIQLALLHLDEITSIYPLNQTTDLFEPCNFPTMQTFIRRSIRLG
jgi:hypothetical protein